MQNQAVVFLVAFFLLAALLSKSDCFSGPLPNGKRELQRKVGLLSVWVFSVVTLIAQNVLHVKPCTSSTSFYNLNIGTLHLTQLFF